MPPPHRVEKISWKDTSKLSGANWAVTPPVTPLGMRFCQATSRASDRCGIATPLGRPVEPEVNST